MPATAPTRLRKPKSAWTTTARRMSSSSKGSDRFRRRLRAAVFLDRNSACGGARTPARPVTLVNRQPPPFPRPSGPKDPSVSAEEHPMSLIHRLSNRTRQRGQAILWFLTTAAACCAVFALVYNVGQVTNEKEKIVNAADASAISGALTEARILNFEAYTNRALIANEVSIAQLVSLDSWFEYNYEITQWLDNYFGWIPY